MIDLYSWTTPNGFKATIMLEECGLAYRLHPVNIGKNEQFAPDFLKISPNNKIPALVDSEGPGGQPLPLFESGAILIYLADKTGRLLPAAGAAPAGDRAKYDVLQWLMFQMGGVGPMLGQAGHFRFFATEKVPYGIERYTAEAKRLYGVMNGQIERTGAFIAGGDYSIADIAIYPWLIHHERHGIDWADYPALKAWFDRISQRPAVQKGLKAFEKQG